METPQDRSLVYIVTPSNTEYEMLAHMYEMIGLKPVHFQKSELFLPFMGIDSYLPAQYHDHPPSHETRKKFIAHDSRTHVAPGTIPGAIVISDQVHQAAHILDEFAGAGGNTNPETSPAAHRVAGQRWRGKGVGLVLLSNNASWSQDYVKVHGGQLAQKADLPLEPSVEDLAGLANATQQSMRVAVLEQRTGRSSKQPQNDRPFP